MKMLYIHNQAKKVNNFSHSSMMAAKKLDIEFHIASNWGYNSCEERIEDEKKYGIKIHQIDFIRRPYDLRNIKAYKQVCDLIKKEKYDVIHCNTPIGGVIGRLAGKKCGVKKIIYQAHGFHFFKGASFFNWLIYYPIEKWLAKITDVLITINTDDYKLAKKKMKLRNNGEIFFVHGVGIDTKMYNKDDVMREVKRKELGIPLDAFVVLSVGELNRNKNNKVVISALNKIKNDSVYYVLCGDGKLYKNLKKQTEINGLVNNVYFLGYRNDINELYNMADCFIMPSIREGLSRSIMEAMASGLPSVVSKIRGNTDLITNMSTGILCESKRIDAYSDAINKLLYNVQLKEYMSRKCREDIKKYDSEIVENEMINIYRTL